MLWLVPQFSFNNIDINSTRLGEEYCRGADVQYFRYCPPRLCNSLSQGYLLSFVDMTEIFGASFLLLNPVL